MHEDIYVDGDHNNDDYSGDDDDNKNFGNLRNMQTPACMNIFGMTVMMMTMTIMITVRMMMRVKMLVI